MKYFFILIFITTQAYAYDWESCRENVFRPIQGGISTGSSQAGLLTVSTGAPTSSIQFSSSFGGCSALREKNRDLNAFWRSNFELIRKDISIGRGEYLDSLIELLTCKKIKSSELSRILRDNFIEIYGEALDRNAEDAYEILRKIITPNLC